MANRRVPYLYTKRGVFYLQKRVPADLQHRYGRPFIRKSLRTKDPKQANRLASSLVDGLEREWLDLRFGISEETPASMIDQIGGWATAGVGQAYGDGYGIDKKWEWMRVLEQFTNKA